MRDSLGLMMISANFSNGNFFFVLRLILIILFQMVCSDLYEFRMVSSDGTLQLFTKASIVRLNSSSE